MKTLAILFAMSLTAIAYSQRNPTSVHFSGTVTNTTQSNSFNSDIKPNRDITTNTTTTTTNSSNNSNNYSNTNTWSNTNSNSNYYNNNNYNNGYNNNNNYNNGYGYNNGYYNNGYYNNNNYSNTYNNSYNNSNTNSNTQNSYKVTDDSYGANLVTEDKTAVVSKSCPYNTTNMLSNYRSTNPIDRFFKSNQKTSQIFIINAQSQNTLKGTDGTIVKIAPNSFVDKNGIVIKGDVEFELKEVYDRSSMVTSNAHTVCNDVPLISGGEMYMGASQGGDPLMLAANSPIAVEIPAHSSEPMQLFYGKPDRNTVNWNLANNNSVTPVLNSSSTTGYSYNFSSNSMNWINCDRFIRNNGNSTKLNVRLPKQYDSTNTAVFVVFAGQNTVTKFDNYTKLENLRIDQNPSSFDTKWYSIPVGSDVTIVALSEINGQYYASMQRTTVAKDQVADLKLEPTTLDQFKLDLEKLP